MSGSQYNKKDYEKIIDLLSKKELSDCTITDENGGPVMEYSMERIRGNIALIHMKAMYTGTGEDLVNQKVILSECFDDKGSKTDIGKVVLSEDFNNSLTAKDWEEIMDGYVSHQIVRDYNPVGFDEEKFQEVVSIYIKYRDHPLIQTNKAFRPPQVMSTRSAILKPNNNFVKKACILPNPEYVESFENEMKELLKEFDRAHTISDNVVKAVDEKKAVAISTMDKLLACCRAGKSIMMMNLSMINTEEKMNVDKAMVTPMCYIDGIPMYNESVHFTSYVKSAINSMKKYFNLKDDGKGKGSTKRRNDDLRRIRQMTDTRQLRRVLTDDCSLLTTLFSGVLLEFMPEHLMGNDMKKNGRCTWLYFLLSNTLVVTGGDSGTWSKAENKLVFLSTTQMLGKRISFYNKNVDIDDDENISPEDRLTSEISKFGFTYIDEDDAGVGQGRISDVFKLGGSQRRLISSLATKVCILAVSATGESDYYRLFMRFTSADAVRAGVTRKTCVTSYSSDPENPSTKINAIIDQYIEHLACHRDVEARSMKAVVIVDTVEDAHTFAGQINNKENKFLLPRGVFNPDGDQHMKAVASTINDTKGVDVVGDFQDDDNHIIFAVNKFSRGVGTQFVSFIGFIRQYSLKSLESAIQTAHRIDVPATVEHLTKRSAQRMEEMTREDKIVAERAIERYAEGQIGSMSFPEEIFFASNANKTTVVNIMQANGLSLDPYLIEEAGIREEVCGTCDRAISMEDSHQDSAGQKYHTSCLGGDKAGMTPVNPDLVKLALSPEDMDKFTWGFEPTNVKKAKVDNSQAKLEAFISYVERQPGGVYSCSGCEMEMCPKVKSSFNMHEGLEANMMYMKKWGVVRTLLEKPTGYTSPDLYDDEDIVRTLCKAKFDNDDGVFTYKESKCNSCVKEEKANRASATRSEHIAKSGARRINRGESVSGGGSSDMSTTDDSSDMSTTDDTTSDSSDDVPEDMDTDLPSSDTTSISREDTVREPPLFEVGPIMNTVIYTCPVGPYGIARAMTEKVGISSTERNRAMMMTNEELDVECKKNPAIKRKRVVEEDVSTTVPAPKRTMPGEMEKLLVKLVHWISVENNTFDDFGECLGLEETEKDDFHEHVLRMAKDDGNDLVEIEEKEGTGSDSPGIKVTLNKGDGELMLETVSLSGSAEDVIGMIGGKSSGDSDLSNIGHITNLADVVSECIRKTLGSRGGVALRRDIINDILSANELGPRCWSDWDTIVDKNIALRTYFKRIESPRRGDNISVLESKGITTSIVMDGRKKYIKYIQN